MNRDAVRAVQECKGVLKHSWYTEPQTLTDNPNVIQINNRCERGCGSTRSMKVDRSGRALTKWNYKHPDGYKEITAESMDAWRAIYIADRYHRRKRAS